MHAVVRVPGPSMTGWLAYDQTTPVDSRKSPREPNRLLGMEVGSDWVLVVVVVVVVAKAVAMKCRSRS